MRAAAIWSALAAVAGAGAARAQEAGVFRPEDFAVYAPQNALDMVRRVPGFALDEGDDRRGFSGSGGNALIDGARPSSKNQDLEDVLARIPAAQVERIELITGAAASAVAPGQSALVNVVRKATGGAGSWEVDLEYTRSGRVSPRGEASWSGRLSGLDISASLDRYIEHRPLSGDVILEDGAGARTGLRQDVSPRTWRELEGAFSVGGRLWDGDFKVNASRGRWAFGTTLNSREFAPAGTPRGGFDFTLREREESGEIGADYARLLGGAALSVVALTREVRFSTDSLRTDIPFATFAGGASSQALREVYGESIARVSLQFAPAPAHRLDVGVEGALNTLKTRLVLTQTQGGGTSPVVLPAANVEVEERRGEAFLVHAWTLSPQWSTEAALRVETSVLSQSGDSAAETKLTFWKPSFQLARRFGERDQIRVKAFRDVGQLDFGDFASSADLFDGGRVNAGNQALAPSSTWRLEAGLDKRFGEGGAVSAVVFRERISDVNDVVPIRTAQGVFDGPGNLGDGEVTGLTLDATLPLGAVLKGGALTLNTTLKESTIADPVTGRDRPFSEFPEVELEAELRQDIAPAKIAWGVSAYKRSEVQFYRRGEVESYEEGVFVDAFVETTAVRGLKLRVWGQNLVDADFSRERVFFSPDRTGPRSGAERRKRRVGPFFGVRVQGVF